MEKEKIIRGVKDLLDKGEQDDRALVDKFLNLLFWRDYGNSHVDCKDRGNIFEEIEKATNFQIFPNDDENYAILDTGKILPFVNKIRKQLGLLELDNTLFSGTLMEMTPEIKKELILKELAK